MVAPPETSPFSRPDVRAWVLYDCANSAFMTTVVAAVFPIYFAEVAAAGLEPATATFRFSVATTVALALITLLSPILGAIADFAGLKKRMLAVFHALGLAATVGMFFIERGDWLLALVLFGLGNIGIYGSLVFYDSLLPHVARADEIDRVSTAGYALGYLAGGILLAINLAWIQLPQTFGFPDAGLAVRVSFLSVAVWWALFAIPLYRRVPEPTRRLEAHEQALADPVTTGFRRLRETFVEIRSYRHAFFMLAAFLIYNDGINTIIRMATIFGSEIGIASQHLIGALLLVQFLGLPFSLLFGRMAARIGTKQAIYLSLVVYTMTSVLGYFMTSAAHFYALAILVGTVQGGSQALSRSLFATMIPPHKSSELFGFFSVAEKFSGIMGPAVFAVSIGVFGSSRHAVVAVIAFFVVGGFLLRFVDVEAGQRAARELEHAAVSRST